MTPERLTQLRRAIPLLPLSLKLRLYSQTGFALSTGISETVSYGSKERRKGSLLNKGKKKRKGTKPTSADIAIYATYDMGISSPYDTWNPVFLASEVEPFPSRKGPIPYMPIDSSNGSPLETADGI